MPTDSPTSSAWSRRRAEAPRPRIPREVILVADQSGSMSGSKWEAAAASIRSFLDGLGPDECLQPLHLLGRGRLVQRPRPGAGHRDEIAAAKRFLEGDLALRLHRARRRPRAGPPPAAASWRRTRVTCSSSPTGRSRTRPGSSASWRAGPRPLAAPGERHRDRHGPELAPGPRAGPARRRRGEVPHRVRRQTATDIGVTLQDLLASWQPPVLADAVLTVDRPGPRGGRLPGRRRSAGVDIGDLRPETPVFVVARVPVSPAPRCSPWPRGGQAVATATARPGDANLATALKVVFGAGRIRTLEYLESAGYDEDEVRRRLGEIGYALPEQEETLYPENRSEAFRSHSSGSSSTSRSGSASPQRTPRSSASPGAPARRRGSRVAVPNALPAGWDDGDERPDSLCAIGTRSVRYGCLIYNPLTHRRIIRDTVSHARHRRYCHLGGGNELTRSGCRRLRCRKPFDVDALAGGGPDVGQPLSPKTRALDHPVLRRPTGSPTSSGRSGSGRGGTSWSSPSRRT